MDFANAEALQAFLATWLEQYDYSVYRKVMRSDGSTIDLLTQDHIIDCRHYLTPESLVSAASELQIAAAEFADLQPVVAGLTPDLQPEALNDLYQAADQLKSSGVEIWFLDQIKAFSEYYKRVVGSSSVTEEDVAKGDLEYSYPRRNPWAGCLVALGMAGILAFSFWLAYRILAGPRAQILSPQDQQAWDQLHKAISVWDIQTAQRNLDVLVNSKQQCVAEFSQQLETRLEENGPEAFREVNPIKRTLNEEERCRLDVTPYTFSP